ncbi:MAG: hypothetical protein QM736_14475 [Vicinamibacterales bacterium]
MNTRLQVEHPITEMVTGVDLVRWQIRIARGEALTLNPQQALTPRGHAIECRIYAEDPDNNFLPSPGRIQQLRVPDGPGIRDDSGATAGLDVPIFYDPMISKLVAWAEDQPAADRPHAPSASAVHRHRIKTTVPFFAWLFDAAGVRRRRFPHHLSRRAPEGAPRTSVRRTDRRRRGSSPRWPPRCKSSSRRRAPGAAATASSPAAQPARQCVRGRRWARAEGLRYSCSPDIEVSGHATGT